jgi:hypothetical protein
MDAPIRREFEREVVLVWAVLDDLPRAHRKSSYAAALAAGRVSGLLNVYLDGLLWNIGNFEMPIRTGEGCPSLRPKHLDESVSNRLARGGVHHRARERPRLARRSISGRGLQTAILPNLSCTQSTKTRAQRPSAH